MAQTKNNCSPFLRRELFFCAQTSAMDRAQGILAQSKQTHAGFANRLGVAFKSAWYALKGSYRSLGRRCEASALALPRLKHPSQKARTLVATNRIQKRRKPYRAHVLPAVR